MHKLQQSSANSHLKCHLLYGSYQIKLLDLIPFNVSEGWAQSSRADRCSALLGARALGTCVAKLRSLLQALAFIAEVNRTYSGLWSKRTQHLSHMFHHMC